jgi:hypothetical protein
VVPPGEEGQGGEVDYAPPSSAVGENGGAIPPLPYAVVLNLA